jgi:3-(3-hydroxy-phenyl)propionate hydroxylase
MSKKELESGQLSAQVVIVGAGPVGLTIANYLGIYGIDTIVLEQLDSLIDYPRAIGVDDEGLRTMQAVGLVDKVLPHTTPFHWMRFETAKGRCWASIEPRTDEFGWPRRNAFIQPLADRILYEGLARFPHVRVLFSHTLRDFTQDEEGITLAAAGPSGEPVVLRAAYMVASDGGRSGVREKEGITFDGKTAPNQWMVVDVRNDPVGTPNITMHCDPKRPYVSAALPHGIRRFEFMVMPGETEESLNRPEVMRGLLAKMVDNPDDVELIRQRVYTHNARLASRFRSGRVVLAGDAAHIMPVWQGQGYNSGLRDAANLGWKLALVAKGIAAPTLLDTYDRERRSHARAMIDLSVLAGKLFAPPKAWMGRVRDGITWLLNYMPPVKRYFLEMRFKPIPRITDGAVVFPAQRNKACPVGKLFIQPHVLLDDGRKVLLDEVTGANFAVVAWSTDPTRRMSPEALEIWRRLGAIFISVKPVVQLGDALEDHPDVVTVGDVTGRLKEWFGSHPQSVAFIRPDRFVAAMSTPQMVSDTTRSLAAALACRGVSAPPSIASPVPGSPVGQQETCARQAA